MTGLSFELRTTWANHLGNQSIDPLRIYQPDSVDQVAEIVRAAHARGVPVLLDAAQSTQFRCLSPLAVIEEIEVVFE